MKGPDNINSLLNKLNTSKTLDTNNNSTISLDELNELDIGSTNNVKANNKKRRSDKNTITLSV